MIGWAHGAVSQRELWEAGAKLRRILQASEVEFDAIAKGATVRSVGVFCQPERSMKP